MAFFSIPHIAVKGIAAAVPKSTASNLTLTGYSEEELHKLVSTLGIKTRRVAQEDQCASDLCIAAAEKLISEMAWDKNDIQVLFFVTQTPDYPLPGSSLHIQERLGLPKSCVTFDINQGCAGYVYGLSLIAGFMSASGLKKGLLIVGDTITKLISPRDKSLIPLFSDCGTATALVFDKQATPMEFNISSEGADYDAIIVPEGGARKPLHGASFEYTGENSSRKGFHLAMKGLDVFNFSLKKVAPNVEELLRQSGRDIASIDQFVFHQANRLILDSISKKLNIASGKVPSSLESYGNTSGASIPLTIVSELKKATKITNSKLVLSGFGVGLSLGSVIVDFKDVICPDIIEL
ncbi:3-oxoacyl-ACP synthase [Sphingobacteriaceae bacterium]|nr:3-oxoacyl-ACP synthase [Sphingobacteriaceae bacterium]